MRVPSQGVRFVLFIINLNKEMKKINTFLLAILFSAPILFTSCGDDEKGDPEPEPETGYNVPTTYEFKDADGNSTVDYSGQTTRIAKFKTLMDELKKGNTSGVEVDAATLHGMFSDDGTYSWEDAELNAATSKKLRDKTKNPGVIDALLDSLANASKSTVVASKGVAGVLADKRLLSANGIEYQQVIEKAMYGALFFNQIANNYLTEEKIGVLVPNNDQDPTSGKYYSSKEHYWDEAFGYFGAPIDFPQEGVSNGGAVYVAKYTYEMDGILGTNISKELMDAFIKGRAAITNNDETVLAEAKTVIYEQVELVFAKAAIHYLNRTRSLIAAGGTTDDANRIHALSEGWGFMMCLPISIQAKVSANDLAAWQATIGSDFWELDSDDLLSVRNEIATKYGISSADRDAL